MAPSALTVLDSGRDGRADVAVANSLDDNVSILLGVGGGGFDTPRNFDVGVSPSSILSGDTDSDGRTDLVVGNGDGTVSLLRAVGSGTGEFAAAVTVAADIDIVPPVIGDFDGDRLIELVVASRSPRRITILAGDRQWTTLTARTGLQVPGQPTGIVAGDLNRDGWLDLVVTRQSADGVTVFINAGDGRFLLPAEHAAGDDPTAVMIADVTGDGQFDVVVTNEQADSLTILPGDRSGRLKGPIQYTVGRGPRRALAHDVNGDTVADVLTVNSFDDTVSLLIGRRAGDLEPAVDFTVGITPLDIAAADFSGDGRVDVMTVNIDEDDLSLLLNNSDHPILFGDVDGSGRIGRSDVDHAITEMFDGDGDGPFDSARGFAAHGASVNANRDARISSADIVAILRAAR